MKSVEAKLAILFLLFSCVVILRIYSTPSYCSTHDSYFYLKTAENIYNGDGIMAPVSIGSEKLEHLSTWPPFYPLFISGAMFITQGNALVASKLVNILCFGAILFIFYRINKANSFWMSLALISFNSFEWFSHTWSEGLFLVFLVLLVWKLHKVIRSETKLWWILPILLGLVFTRYAGLILVLIYTIVSSYYLRKGTQKRLREHSTMVFTVLVVVGGFLSYNKYKSGYFFGMEREQNTFDFLEFLKEAAWSFLNEINFLVNSYQNIYIFIFSVLIVLALLVYIFIKRDLIFRPELHSKLWFVVGGMYSLYILLLSHDQFLEGRILGIGTTLGLVGVMSWFTQKKNEAFLSVIEKPLYVLFGLTFILNLPKQFIWESVMGLFL